MLALIGVNLLAGACFAGIYALATTGALVPGAAAALLAFVFTGATALWVRTERSVSRGRDPLSRVGIGAISLLAVVIGAPVAVLMPLFSLERLLPPGAPEAEVVPLAMALVLVGLALVVLMNLVGAAVVVGATVVRRLRGARPPG